MHITLPLSSEEKLAAVWALSWKLMAAWLSFKNRAGVHPKDLFLNFAESVSFSGNSKYNSSNRNVSATIDRLFHEKSKCPVRLTKKNVALLKHLVTLYSLMKKTVLSTFASTFTTTNAAMESGMWVFAVEENLVFYRPALESQERLAILHLEPPVFFKPVAAITKNMRETRVNIQKQKR